MAFIQAANSSYSATRSPSITFATSPLEDDVIVIYIGSTGSATFTSGDEPAGWVNCLADNTILDPGDGSLMAVVLYHIVTAGEDSADTVTWTLTNLWTNTEVGDVAAAYFRDVDTAAVIDAFGSTVDPANAATHTLPVVTGTDITVSGGDVVRGVFKDTTGTYTDPAGHTMRTSTNVNHGVWLGTRDTDSTAGVDVAVVNITPSTADEYISVSLVLTPIVLPEEFVDEDDPVGITDSVTLLVGNVSEPGDNVGITDDEDVLLDKIVDDGADVLVITDSVDLTFGTTTLSIDDVGITDSVGASLGVPVTATDNVGITDAASSIRGIARSFTDTVGIDDDATVDSAPAGPTNVCLEFGAPVFVTRSAPTAAFVDREADLALVNHVVGSPVFQDRDANLAIQDRDADVAISCLED